MKNLLPRILFYYSAVASFFIAGSLALSSNTVMPLVFNIFFLPVAGYFIIVLFTSRQSDSESDTSFRKGDLFFIFFIFLMLFGIAAKNIITGTNPGGIPLASPPASSEPLIFKSSPSPSAESATPSASITPKSATPAGSTTSGNTRTLIIK